MVIWPEDDLSHYPGNQKGCCFWNACCDSEQINTFHCRLDRSSPICKDAFCGIIGTNYRTLQRWMQLVCSDADVEPHGNCGRAPHNALSRLDKNRVVSFIMNYAALHALPDPAQLQPWEDQRLCSGEWQNTKVCVCQVFQGHRVHHTSTTATLPLQVDQSAEAAVNLAQCSSGSSNTSFCT